MITFAKGPDGERVHVDETMSRLEYTCFVCGAPLVTHKGNVYRHHFKNKGVRACTDSWHGTYCDSEWHFSWQGRYPLQNRERVLERGSIKQRADVLVGETVVEFQYSTLGKAQFDDRNAFYGYLGHKVVWLFDLREAYVKGEIVPKSGEDSASGALPMSFVWNNPRQAFNAYDPLRGDVDLFFQLADDDGGKCVVRVRESCKRGFEEFRVSAWLTADEFLAHTGLDAKGCPGPNLAPLKSSPDYERFRERYGIRLDDQQERAAQAESGLTLLLAVPGSGKTTTMVARLGYLIVDRRVDPKSVIALTYCKDAADEMRTRFARQFRDRSLAEAITFSTINAFCRKIYREWCDKNSARRPKREEIKEGDAKKLLKKLYREATGEFVSEGKLIRLAMTISWLKNSMQEPDDLPWLDDEIPHFTETYERYCERLRLNRKMDFDDQLRFAKFALEHDEELLAKYRSRYRYWCVDEAQDTSRIQHHVIRMLAGAEGSGNVFMVDDEDQSIYGYRGAYPQALLSFPFDYPNARTLRMETNYRSGDEIVSAARTFIGGCRGRIDKRMVSRRGPGSVVRVEEVASRLDQFDASLALIRNHLREGRDTLAVLYRNNETAVPLIDQLIRESIAFTLSGNANTFFTSPTVMDVKAFMRLALDHADEKSFMHVYSKGGPAIISRDDAVWACRNAKRKRTSILDEFVAQMHSYRKGWQVKKDVPKARAFATLVRGLASLSPLGAIDRLLENGYGEWLEDQGRSTRKIDLLKPIADREQTIQTFLARLEYLSTSYDKEHPNHPISDAITLATTHSCKGREFDKVIVIDAIDGIFPSSCRDPLDYGKDEARYWQEERRLFYVAMTRAKDELVLLRPEDEDTPFVDEVFPRPVPDSKAMSASEEKRDRPVADITAPGAPNPQENAPTLAPKPEAASILTTGSMTARGPVVAATAPSLGAGVSRYDVDTWAVLERRGHSYLKAEHGGMQAEITRGIAGMTVDLMVPWSEEQIVDVADHIGDYA